MTEGKVLVKSYGKMVLAVLALAATAAGPSKGSKSAQVAAVITPEQILADWLRQDEIRNAAPVAKGKKTTPEQDAIGACDGIKDGKWGFHTENENKPWWQIDLGESTALDRIILYNRCDLAERNSRLIVLLSE